jgi:hypothetical protein
MISVGNIPKLATEDWHSDSLDYGNIGHVIHMHYMQYLEKVKYESYRFALPHLSLPLFPFNRPWGMVPSLLLVYVACVPSPTRFFLLLFPSTKMAFLFDFFRICWPQTLEITRIYIYSTALEVGCAIPECFTLNSPSTSTYGGWGKYWFLLILLHCILQHMAESWERCHGNSLNSRVLVSLWNIL